MMPTSTICVALSHSSKSRIRGEKYMGDGYSDDSLPSCVCTYEGWSSVKKLREQ